MTYYLLQGTERLGPFTEEQVRGMLAAGQAQPDTPAWRDGLADWTPLGSLLGTSVPPPAPGTTTALVPASSPGVRIFKGCLMAFGVIAALGVVVGGIAFGIFAYFGTGFDSSSKAYVDDAVPAIVTNWSSDELLQRIDPAYASYFKKEDIDVLFQKFARLGAYQRYKSSTGDSRMNIGPDGLKVTAKYDCLASFKNGDATITVTLIRDAGQWKIIGFHIASSALL